MRRKYNKYKGKNDETVRIAASAPMAIRKARGLRAVKMYTPEIVDELLLRLGEGEETLNAICNDERMPNRNIVHRWMDEHPEFRERMLRAREMARMAYEDHVLDIADNSEGEVARDKLRIETRFKLLERADALERQQIKKSQDPKLIEAEKDSGGQWRVGENGERLNRLSEAIERFRASKGLVKAAS